MTPHTNTDLSTKIGTVWSLITTIYAGFSMQEILGIIGAIGVFVSIWATIRRDRREQKLYEANLQNHSNHSKIE